MVVVVDAERSAIQLRQELAQLGFINVPRANLQKPRVEGFDAAGTAISTLDTA